MKSYKIDKLTGICTSIEKNPSEMSQKQFLRWCERELSATPNGLNGLYQVNGQWRSEHLDVAKAA